jgi:putative transposase
LGLSQRKACRVIGLCRATWQYEPKPESALNKALRVRIREIAAQRRRFGSFRIWQMLVRQGWTINKKRVQRIYVEEKLSLRIKRRIKRAAAVRVPLPKPTAPNQVWSIDFVWDWVQSGRKLKMLTVVDDFTHECLAIEADSGIRARCVTQVLERLIEQRGLVAAIRSDNGSEFAGNVMDEWAYRKNIKLDFIRPGKPNDNAFVESFNGKFRDECLNENRFLTLIEAQTIIEAWRRDFNDERPHTAHGKLTPSEFAAQHTTMLKKLALAEHQSALA